MWSIHKARICWLAASTPREHQPWLLSLLPALLLCTLVQQHGVCSLLLTPALLLLLCCSLLPNQAFLIDGMESQSQAKVGSALQVFFNLEALNRVRVVGAWCGVLLRLGGTHALTRQLGPRHNSSSSCWVATLTCALAAAAAVSAGCGWAAAQPYGTARRRRHVSSGCLNPQLTAVVGKTLHVQEVDAVLCQHIHELERSFKQSLDSRHLSSMAAAAAATTASGSSGTHQPGGGPGGARGLTIPAPGAAGSWQVCGL